MTLNYLDNGWNGAHMPLFIITIASLALSFQHHYYRSQPLSFTMPASPFNSVQRDVLQEYLPDYLEKEGDTAKHEHLMAIITEILEHEAFKGKLSTDRTDSKWKKVSLLYPLTVLAFLTLGFRQSRKYSQTNATRLIVRI